jgi:hypothetical protein
VISLALLLLVHPGSDGGGARAEDKQPPISAACRASPCLSLGDELKHWRSVCGIETPPAICRRSILTTCADGRAVLMLHFGTATRHDYFDANGRLVGRRKQGDVGGEAQYGETVDCHAIRDSHLIPSLSDGGFATLTGPSSVRHIEDYLSVPTVRAAAEGDYSAMCDGTILKSKPADRKKCEADARRGQMVVHACLHERDRADAGVLSDTDFDQCERSFAPFK